MTENKYEKAVIAYDQGYGIATRLQSGDIFHGGATLAEKCYDAGSLQHRLFIQGYVDGLDARFGSSVKCDVVRGSDGTEVYLIK